MKDREHFQFPMILLFIALLASAGGMHPSQSAEVPLGSPDFMPSVTRPFGFRGDGSGRFPGATPPLAWSEKKNVRWSAVVGKSFSSPILAGKYVLVTSEPSLLICLDRMTGAVRWKLETNPAGLADEKSRKQAADYQPAPAGAGMSAATPVTDGKNVYVVFANGIVRAVDLDGKPRWTSFIGAEQNTGYGRSASPIIAAGRLIVHMTNLYAFDLDTGKQLWVNEEAKSRYGSPAAFMSGETTLIATPAGDVVRVDDGKSVGASIGSGFNSTPLAAGGVIYFGEKEVKAVRLNAAFKDEEVWSSDMDGDVFGSPLLHDGMLFTATSLGELYAFNAEAKGTSDAVIKGRSVFAEEGVEAAPVSVYASLTLAGKYFFLSTTHGEIVVLDANREAKRIAKNILPGDSGGTPIFTGKEMFLRDGSNLLCIAEQD